ncbi:MAG: hypothetical protein GIX03_13860 [Candidatus Eremiobacteraeota bacterium]|nr:hypothetical protein [Candidatus Eremiobacteraeota bacterium]MBC5821712.1 hypothetical protein [Candidatus Eremiobacteraeota bacterium]
MLVALLVVGTTDALRRLLPPPVQPPNETVVVSTALHLERRPRPAPAHPSRIARARALLRTVRHVAPPAAAKPALSVKRAKSTAKRVPARAPRELARLARHATPVPSVAAPRTPGARNAARVARGATQVAYAPRRPRPQSATDTGRAGTYSRAQLAAIENDLARSIAHDRSADSPLSTVARPVHPAATAREQAVNFSGVDAHLHGFEGLCDPVKSWPSGSYVYFYVTCRVTHDDGLVRQEALPWPIRYPARRLSYDEDGPQLPPGAPVPPPLPGWHADPTQKLDPDVILYLRKYGYSI